MSGEAGSVSLNEKWKECAENCREYVFGNECERRAIKQAFYAGAEAVAEEYCIRNIQAEVEQFKRAK